MAESDFTPDPSLVTGARREGRLVWYSTWTQPDADKVIAAFTARYPFVDFQGRYHPNAFPDIEAERRTGAYAMDLVGPTTATTTTKFADQGYFAAYDSPSAWDLDPKFYDRQGRWWASHFMGICYAYNTDLVPPERRPRAWRDLLDPYWRGKILLEDGRKSGTIYEWFTSLLRTEGEEYLRELARQDIRWYRGGAVTRVLDMLAAGEAPLTPWAVDYMAQQRTDRGEPIGWGNPTLLGRIPAFAISAQAPHPNAARLFIDWLLSPEGQRLVGAENLGQPVRPGLPSYMARFYAEGAAFPINDPAAVIADLPRLHQLYLDIFFAGQAG
jgi:iron(III) transport system substrate-binding protein